MLAEALDDIGVREAVGQPMVDLVAKWLWKARDLAVAAMEEGGERVGGFRFRSWDLVVGVHGSKKSGRI